MADPDRSHDARNHTKNNRPWMPSGLWILLPFLIWVVIFSSFPAQQRALGHDAPIHVSRVQYYVNAVLNGTLPFWDPFNAWGKEDLCIKLFSEFNPVLYIIPFGMLLGIPFYTAYFIFLFLYFFIGMAGFYRLASTMLKDTRLAFLAYALVMFSSLGATIFSDPAILLLFVPAVWFFAFLAEALTALKPRNILGMTFCAMIIATTYIPFYFLTIFLTVTVMAALLFPRRTLAFAREMFIYGARHRFLTIVMILLVVVSLIPNTLWFLENRTGQYVDTTRQFETIDGHTARISIKTAGKSPFSQYILMANPLTGLDLYSSTTALFFYIPLIWYIIALIGMFSSVTKKGLLLFLSVFVLFLIGLTTATPVFPFLYTHVFFFQLFRNLYYLTYLSIPIAVLFGAHVIKQTFLAEAVPKSAQPRPWTALGITLVHTGIISLLLTSDQTLTASVLTAVGSWILFTSWALGWFPFSRNIFFSLLISICLIEPIHVFHHFVLNSPSSVTRHDDARQRPRFSFVRPAKADDARLKIYDNDFWVMKKPMADTSGLNLDNNGFFGLKYAHDLFANINHAILEPYTRYKLIAYDHTENTDPDTFDPHRLTALFASNRNLALIADSSAPAQAGTTVDGAPTRFTENTDELTVLSFDQNELVLRTAFPSKKFLVYNDSYQKKWRTVIDGSAATLFRANHAFKGVWVPAGTHTVAFRFGSPWSHRGRLLLIFLYAGVLAWVIYLHLVPSPRGPQITRLRP